jgi:hypothetical protein
MQKNCDLTLYKSVYVPDIYTQNETINRVDIFLHLGTIFTNWGLLNFLLDSKQPHINLLHSRMLEYLLSVVSPIAITFYQAVASEKSQKLLITVTIFFLLLTITSLTSFGLYLTFYSLVVPNPRILLPIYFDYSTKSPLALVNYALQPSSTYDLNVLIEVADSPANFALGNFMIQIELDELVSRRPVLINYKSNLLLSMTTLWKLASIFLANGRESQLIKVPLISNYVQQTPVNEMSIILSTDKLQTYSSYLEVVTHFNG